MAAFFVGILPFWGWYKSGIRLAISMGMAKVQKWIYSGLPGNFADSRFKNQILPEASSWVGLPGKVITKCSDLVMVYGR